MQVYYRDKVWGQLCKRMCLFWSNWHPVQIKKKWILNFFLFKKKTFAERFCLIQVLKFKKYLTPYPKHEIERTKNFFKGGGGVLWSTISASAMTEANYRYLTLWHNSVLLLFLGTGSVLNTKGEVEMDSVIMDGRELQCGSVACVQNIKNPVSLARAVLEKVRRQHSTPSLNISDLIYTYLSWELKKKILFGFWKK